MVISLLELVGGWLAKRLSQPRERGVHVSTTSPEILASVLKKGDVLLVEGTSRFGLVVKYLTQSTWSHAALYIGNALDPQTVGEEARVLVEADVNEGVRAIPLSMYAELHTRICRPVGLRPEEIDAVVEYVIGRLGHRYDLKNIIDLGRYVVQTPPVPRRWRRQLLALGSGDPTKAICSSLIAEAFQSVHYPVLPDVEIRRSNHPACVECHEEILRIRNSSLFTPRDFDVSPYFRIIKPTIDHEFDPHQLRWGDQTELVSTCDTIEPRLSMNGCGREESVAVRGIV